MKINILIVDDNNDFTAQLRSLFDAAPDMSVVGTAGDGEQATEMFNRLSPDLVILDLVMPKKDGFGFMQSINMGNSKILVLSALSKDVFISKALECGADYYMR